MINPNRTKHLIEKELFVIADSIISKTMKDNTGYYWQCLKSDPLTSKLYLDVENTIYSGNPGIVLFFLELFKITKSHRLKSVVISGSNWILKNFDHDKSTNPSLYSGSYGIVYLCTELYITFKKKSYLDYAINIALKEKENIKLLDKCEMLNGKSGCVLTLLKLHSVSNNQQILNLIFDCIVDIIKQSKMSKVGFFWDADIDRIKGLCGFSHGAAGIGYMFSVAAKYFNNNEYNWIAEQAFNYEDQFYNKKLNNWPDFRKLFDAEESLYKAYLNKHWHVFKPKYNLNAWCHGAAGIGMARVAALSEKKDYISNSAKLAIKKTVNDLKNNKIYRKRHTLCHGLAGNALLFIEAYKTTHEKKYYDLALKSTLALLTEKQKNNNYIFREYPNSSESPELFMGLSGVGYSLINILHPYKVNNLLLPKVNQYKTNAFEVKKSNVKAILAKSHFPRTIHVIQILLKQFITDYFKRNYPKVNLLEYVENLIFSAIKKLRKENREIVLEIYKFELTKLKAHQKIKNYTLWYLQNEEFKKLYIELSAKPNISIHKLELQLPKFSKVIKAKWDWENVFNLLSKDDFKLNIVNQNVVLIPNIYGVNEYWLTELNTVIIHCVLNKINTGEQILRYITNYVNNNFKQAELLNIINTQLKNNLDNGLLLVVKKTEPHKKLG